MPASWIAAVTTPSDHLRAVAVEQYADSHQLVTALATVWDTTFRTDTVQMLTALFAHTGWDSIDPHAQPGRTPPIGGGIAVPGVGYATPSAFAPPTATTGAPRAALLRRARRVVEIRPSGGLLIVHQRHRGSWTHRLADGPPRPGLRKL